MTDEFYLYAALVGMVCLAITGMVLSALLVGWWGLRKARKQGRYCPDCGRWDNDPAEILTHRILEHWHSTSG